MENLNLIDTFSEFKDLKNIDRPTMMRVLEDVFRSTLVKKFGTDENFDILLISIKGILKSGEIAKLLKMMN
jgi:N utilization substance protein A